MRLLENKQDWLAWKSDKIFDGDVALEPIEFPCFVFAKVKNWAYENIEATYLYKDRLREMI